MRVFVPVEDGSFDADAGLLVPYRCGVACAHELRATLIFEDGVWRERDALNDGSSPDRPERSRASLPGRH